MATKQEINNAYKEIFGKDFPTSTLSKWAREGKIKTTEIPIGERKGTNKYDYDLEDFKRIITDPSYKARGPKQKPEDYIGTMAGYLEIVGIVPEEEKREKYNGHLMYCKCHKCNREDLVQVRFSYLTPNGNYFQESCGCARKERAFLASCRDGISEEFFDTYFQNDFDRFLFLHKLLRSVTDKYYQNCSIEEYENAILKLHKDTQLQKVYDFWKSKENTLNTFYDWAKPSLDHIVPKSKGGSNSIDNLQVLTVFENLAKRDMTWEEWEQFKKETNTTSEYYIENILKL